jgi:predicted transposase/invertase (TIGR01784 family)
MPKKSTTVEGTPQVPVVGKYIDLTTDFGFKRIFGEENVDLLINFLNSVLKLNDPIVSLRYTNVEHKGRTKDDRSAYFDLKCTTSNGEYIIIEVQREYQQYFVDRVLFYLSFIIQRQGKKGKSDYKLNPIYSVNILDFKMTDNDKRRISHVQLMDVERKTLFYDKLSLLFIELPKFTKDTDKLQTNEEWWCHLLKHISKYQEVPEQLKENKIFSKLFKEAEIANMTPEEYELYVESLKRKNMFNKPQDFVNAARKALKESQKENKILTNKVSTMSGQISTQAAEIAQLKQMLKQAGLA